jgi:hypothetical protein
MDEVWMRLAVVSAAAAIICAAALLARRQSKAVESRMSAISLPQGVHLFTSETCSACVPARKAVESAFGPGGYQEISWEDNAGRFAEVEKVPTVIIVKDDGSAVRWVGVPSVKDLIGVDP